MTERFVKALNERDLEALRALVNEDVEFRNPQGGEALRGDEGLQALVAAAADTDLHMVPEGDEEVEEEGRVSVPVRVVLGGGDHVHGTAVFEIRGKVAAFEVVSELVSR